MENHIETFKIKTDWHRSTNSFSYDTFNRNHVITFSGEQSINNSAAAAYNGNQDMSNPEELLASSISSCHMLTFLAVASKSGFMVDSYLDEAVAYLEKNAENILAVTKVFLHPEIKFSGEKVPDQEKIKSMHEKAHKNCFIANSVKCLVEVVSI